MAKLYPCRGWKNTGFTTGNIPDGPAVLAKAPVVDFNALFIWQNRELGQIRVEAEWETIREVDYIRLGPETDAAFYVVTECRMRSDYTAELDITMDPLATAGGVSAIQVIAGFAERAHTATDELFSNEIEEPWGPSAPLMMEEPYAINKRTPTLEQKDLSVTISTADLSKMKDIKALVAKAADDPEASVVWPQIPKQTGSFSIRIQNELHTENWGFLQIPGIGAYNTETAAQDIADARSLGIESAILNSYMLPADLVQIAGSEGLNGEIQQLLTTVKHFDVPFHWEYTTSYVPKNKKVFALYNNISVISASSGDKRDFEARDLYAPGTITPSFNLIVDPAPNGTTYLQPTSYQRRAPKMLDQAVAGLPWVNAAVIYNGASGSSLTLANARRAQESADLARTREVTSQAINRDELNHRTIENAFSAIGQMVGMSGEGSNLMNLDFSKIGSMAGQAMNTARAYERQALQEAYTAGTYKRQMGDRIFSAMVSTRVVSPTLAFPVSMNVGAMQGNAYLVTQTHLQAADVERFDKFLTAYGYACDKPFEKTDLTNRTRFNYIKTSGAAVKAAGIPARTLSAIGEMFDAGIRVWHELPNAAAMSDNPITGVT